jgi:hypothetical protein
MEPAINLEVVDLTPRFLAFYEAAQAVDTDADVRWRLWQEHYGFAAVPPTPDGQALARRLLDEAWTAYPGVPAQLYLWHRHDRIGTRGHYAGWVVVGYLLEQGWTLGRLAHVPEDGLVSLVSEAIRSRLASA